MSSVTSRFGARKRPSRPKRPWRLRLCRRPSRAPWLAAAAHRRPGLQRGAVSVELSGACPLRLLHANHRNRRLRCGHLRIRAHLVALRPSTHVRRPVYRESREEDLCKRTLRIRTACLCALRCVVATLIQNRRELFHTREFAASQSQLTLVLYVDRGAAQRVPHRNETTDYATLERRRGTSGHVRPLVLPRVSELIQGALAGGHR
jgi:hypothetical protein